jgi:alpha-ketoglutarate-dependent taurine dioxygenase
MSYRIQFFTAVTASPKNTGFTLFATSPMIWKYLPAPLTIDYLRNLTWSVSTSSFNSSIIRGLPLIQDHPHNSQPCLRYHEPWPQSKTAFEATNVMIDNVTTEVEGKAVCDALTALLHDRRVALYHTWEKGDLLVSDNVLAMHTRSDFTAGCDRELWRIHVE